MNQEQLTKQLLNLVAGLVIEHYSERKDKNLEEQLFCKIRKLLPYCEGEGKSTHKTETFRKAKKEMAE